MDAPFVSYRVTVPDAWIDLNGHMNATHYGLVIYEAQAAFTTAIGLGDEYVDGTGCGKAVLEKHIVYEREVSKGAELEMRSYLLAVDSKRLHFFHEMFDLTEGRRAATGEQVDVHFDLKRRRACDLPVAKRDHLRGIVRAHLGVPRPMGIGSRMRPPNNDWL